VGLSRDNFRHAPAPRVQTEAWKAKIVEIARVRRRFGYRRVQDLLCPKFPGVNCNRVYRLYSAANLTVRKCKNIRRLVAERTPLNIATKVKEVWSIYFVNDSLADGRRLKYLKCLTVADDYSRE
jgi:putative transposase